MHIAREEFLIKLRDEYMREIMCEDIVTTYANKRFEIDVSGSIMVLGRHCAWKEALVRAEQKLDIQGEILFVLYKNMTGESYRVSTVPISPGSFEFRKGLLPEWRGKMQKELRETTDIKDMVFCHHSGFIGGAVSLESAIKMARVSLAYTEKAQSEKIEEEVQEDKKSE